LPPNHLMASRSRKTCWRQVFFLAKKNILEHFHLTLWWILVAKNILEPLHWTLRQQGSGHQLQCWAEYRFDFFNYDMFFKNIYIFKITPEVISLVSWAGSPPNGINMGPSQISFQADWHMTRTPIFHPHDSRPVRVSRPPLLPAPSPIAILAPGGTGVNAGRQSPEPAAAVRLRWWLTAAPPIVSLHTLMNAQRSSEERTILTRRSYGGQEREWAPLVWKSLGSEAPLNLMASGPSARWMAGLAVPLRGTCRQQRRGGPCHVRSGGEL
jgi:hypothetical protein